MSQMSEEDIKMIFDACDEDGNGFVKRSEVKNLFLKMNRPEDVADRCATVSFIFNISFEWLEVNLFYGHFKNLCNKLFSFA